MDYTRSLSATNLGVFQHLDCELYIHKAYHNPRRAFDAIGPRKSEEKAVFQKGLDWESHLLTFLDDSNMLLRIPTRLVDGRTLLENILAEDRPHFFISGIAFRPPREKLQADFDRYKSPPLEFGVAKPDLLEVTKTDEGLLWRIIDAKSSNFVKASHQIQVYFYTVCMSYLLEDPAFIRSDSPAVWIPPQDQSHLAPSFEDIKETSLDLLAEKFHNMIFHRLPIILRAPSEQIEWHYNAKCRDCRYASECGPKNKEGGYLGNLPNLSADDAEILKQLLKISGQYAGDQNRIETTTDIEDLQRVLSRPDTFQHIEKDHPLIVKKVRRVLKLRTLIRQGTTVLESPLLKAYTSKTPQAIPFYNYTCPSEEELAIVISVFEGQYFQKDTSLFCVTIHSYHDNNDVSPMFCSSSDIMTYLTEVVQTVASPSSNKSYQFYVWSATEHAILQKSLVDAISNSSARDANIRTCVSALVDGASVIHSEYHPHVLRVCHTNFLANANGKQCRSFLERLGIPSDGFLQEKRAKIEEEFRRLQKGGRSKDRRAAFGRLPPIVILKTEIERQLALPIAGYWDLKEYISTFLPSEGACPDNDDLFRAFKKDDTYSLRDLMLSRNSFVYAALRDFRGRAVSEFGQSYLINHGTQVLLRQVKVCQEPNIRKLFYMQQLEVLSKLNMLWRSRAEGCVNSPVLKLRPSQSNGHHNEYRFDIIRGNIGDSMMSARLFPGVFTHLLVKLPHDAIEAEETLPTEAFFEDIPMSNSTFPLTAFGTSRWNQQHDEVKKSIVLAHLGEPVNSQTHDNTFTTTVVIRVHDPRFLPQTGEIFRLSPRFVDFNIPKVLGSLFETDVNWEMAVNTTDEQGETQPQHRHIPFLHLITESASLQQAPARYSKASIDIEDSIQTSYTNIEGPGKDYASQLILQPSQRSAMLAALLHRLSIVWGPPGTGKTHTISLSLLRLLQIEWSLTRPHVTVLVTAFTHAALGVVHKKLSDLIEMYRKASPTPVEWLDDIDIQYVDKQLEGSRRNNPGKRMQIYIGTVFQVCSTHITFTVSPDARSTSQLSKIIKRRAIIADCLIVDEAGQLPLSSISLVTQSLTDTARMIIAGDPEQLAPIFTAKYPVTKTTPIFGSVLDCIMHPREASHPGKIDAMPSRFVQLTENFRNRGAVALSQALGRFKLNDARDLPGIPNAVVKSVYLFLEALSTATKKHSQSDVPRSGTHMHREIYGNACAGGPPLSLIRLTYIYSDPSTTKDFETQLNTEASVAASLALILFQLLPSSLICVATPYRAQKERLKNTLASLNVNHPNPALEESFKTLSISAKPQTRGIVVNTMEHLQGTQHTRTKNWHTENVPCTGSEADIVICLFSAPPRTSSDAEFLLDRRRLNVALSRARHLCILVTTNELLRPSPSIAIKESSYQGLAFLQTFEKMAWSYDLRVDVHSK
ncbi:hypothetical protein CVT26_011001 [Gymnopilus dilepis]|uniref:Uncharacterized protein n=1 Tax=Gymnopilus dilepis TaxID=231916 RepID=A0A409VYB5_9AGAR|nr:hypothetical protein CVT26_011001 [Gymnopilus dilepis]